MSTSTPSSPPEPPEGHVLDDHLTNVQAFRRLVARVSACAGRWLVYRSIPEADRDDVVQEALLRMYLRRASYEPARSNWESWAFAFVGRAVQNYRSGRSNRVKHVDVALDVLPETATDAPSPEEEAESAMMHALLKRCWSNLDEDSRAILHAHAEGIEMTDIAAAFGLSRSAAYTRLQTARARLQAALDREQTRKRALGLMVLPLSIDQLLAWDKSTAQVSVETMRRIWKVLDQAMAADMAAGKLRNEGTEVVRYMGSPSTMPPARSGARLLRALGPRSLSALTHVIAVTVGAGGMYALLRHDPPHEDATAEVRAAASSLVVSGGYSHDPAPPPIAAPSMARSSGAREERELDADAGVAEQTDASVDPSTADRDGITGEQVLFNRGSVAYQGGDDDAAITAFREHSTKYPRSKYSASRERLFTLALLHTGRKAEARQRIELLRRTSPGSALIAELDAALSANDP